MGKAQSKAELNKGIRFHCLRYNLEDKVVIATVKILLEKETQVELGCFIEIRCINLILLTLDQR